MTPEQEALVAVVRSLEQLGIPHMLTGSVASCFHGRPRSTHDAAGRSEKQIADAAGVVAVNRSVDRAYVERWARELDVLDLWQEIAGETPASE